MSMSDLPVEANLPAHPAIEAAPPPAADGRPLELPVNDIQPNPHQPRREFDQSALAELAGSIKANGLIQPIIVRVTDSGFQLIAGERRLRAAKLAGLPTIPAIVRSVDGFSQAQMALVENIQREDLNPIERAQAYRALLDQLGLTQAELAGRLGEDRSSIANFLRLLDLIDPVQSMVRDGQLSLGHAKILAGVGEPVEQERLARLVVAQGLSVRNLERLVQGKTATAAPRAVGAGSAHLQDLERTLARQLGMRVQLRAAKKGKGRLIVHYASLDEFDDLLSRLGVKAE
jgi:ParB family chromosome partitioning protein